MSDALAIVSGDIYATRDAFVAAQVERSMSFEREAGFAVQLLQNSEYLVRVASNNRQSLVNAITNVAALGLSLNPAKKQAYLVPRDGKICLDASWMGLIDLAVECGSIVFAQAQVVYSTESLQIHGFDRPPTHTRNPFAKDRGDIVGAYCVAKLMGGDYLTETMSIEELTSIRDRSEAWKKKQAGPWKTDFAEMCRKTVVKRASKYWPRVAGDERLERAIHHLNTEGEEGLSQAAVVAPAQAAVDYAAQIPGCKTEAELTKLYGEAMADYAKSKDKAAATKFKASAIAHRETLRQANTIEMEGTQQ